VDTDDQCFNEKGDGRGGVRRTIAELIQKGLKDSLGTSAPMLRPAPKGAGSRAAKKVLLHQALSFKRGPGGKLLPWEMPRLTFHTDAVKCRSTIPALPLSDNDPEDIDSDAYDHAYDSLCNVLLTRTRKVEPVKRPDPPDTHRTPKPPAPGYEPRYTGRG
jgi:hypothetical protein